MLCELARRPVPSEPAGTFLDGERLAACDDQLIKLPPPAACFYWPEMERSSS